MKTLIRKEIRLLLPAWITAMLLVIIPGFINIVWTCSAREFAASDGIFGFVQLTFVAGVLFLGINSFGEELSCNTFSALLSQPMKRPRIWLIKVATLAAAFILVWLTGILFDSWQIGVLKPEVREEFSTAFEFLTLSALVTFSGGLWTTLLLRQTTTAFWITLLMPLAVICGISVVLQAWIVRGQSINTAIVVALVLYSVAGFFVARRLFMRAQDIQWTGSEVSFPRREKPFKAGAISLSIRPRHWLSALAWKELQLHQGTFLIAAIVLGLHLFAVLIRTFRPPMQNTDWQFVLDAVWTIWLLMPLLIGVAAIAEERRMNTLEAQLCLPASRGVQLLVKFCIALVLSLFFGALMPVLIEGTKTLDQWHWIFVVAAAMFYVSFYASSLGRTTLQSIGFAILVALVIQYYEYYEGWTGFNDIRPRFAHYPSPEYGIELLTERLSLVVLLIVLGWLTFSNFKHVHQNWKFWMRNITAIVAVFVCVPILAKLLLGLTDWILF